MKRDILQIMPVRLRAVVGQGLKGREGLEEIRIRVGQPPELRYGDKSIWLLESVMAEDLEEMLTYISRYSIYAYEEEIRQGYITIEGGNRVGFAGQIRMEGGRVRRMTNIRFLNIRIAGEKRGCANGLLPWLYEEGEFLNTLLISKPGIGKTTYLRDCVRMVSNGTGEWDGKKICVIDERSEIAACHMGIPQNDIGSRTDVLDGCPKQEGMLMALRSMSPEIIAVDELGGEQDSAVVERVALSGCRVLGTLHGDSMERVLKMEEIGKMHRQKLFQRYVFLKKDDKGNRFYQIYNQESERLC